MVTKGRLDAPPEDDTKEKGKSETYIVSHTEHTPASFLHAVVCDA